MKLALLCSIEYLANNKGISCSFVLSKTRFTATQMWNREQTRKSVSILRLSKRMLNANSSLVKRRQSNGRLNKERKKEKKKDGGERNFTSKRSKNKNPLAEKSVCCDAWLPTDGIWSACTILLLLAMKWFPSHTKS